MIKKFNALLTWLLTASLIGHIILTVSLLWSRSYNVGLGKVFAAITMFTACLHAVISIGIMMFAADGTAAFKYAKVNVLTVIQRITAIAICVFIHFHLGAFDFIQPSSAKAMTNADAIWLIVTEFLFFGSVFMHLGVSFSRSAIVFGGVSDKRKMRVIDTAVYSICGVIFAVIMTALIRFVIIWF